MLNGYAFSKRLEEFKKMGQEQNKGQRIQVKHSQSREQLASNYKYRVEQFIQDVSVNFKTNGA